MKGYKTINDTIHGTIRIGPMILDLLETLEVQRLNGIRQLGLTYLVFPGANHSRIEHALGASHMAEQICRVTNIPEDEKKLVTAAAFLHDVGHGPFSHTLEQVLDETLGMDHMDFTKEIILGKADNVSEEEREAFPDVMRIPEVLEKHGVEPADVSDLIKGESAVYRIDRLPTDEEPLYPGKRYLPQMIHGAVDADQLDYLQRDAHYTGVAHGIFDVERLIQTFVIHRNQLMVHRKGVTALESMLVARALMFSTVYFHKTVRLAELMLARAVERAGRDLKDIQRMVDTELINWLLEHGGHQRDIALRLKYRKLYKRAYTLSREELDRDRREILSELTDPKRRSRKEEMICRRAGIPSGKAFIDIPSPEILATEPRFSRFDAKILEGSRVRQLGRVSPIARSLKMREVSDWVLMVGCDPAHREAVGKVAEKVIFG